MPTRPQVHRSSPPAPSADAARGTTDERGYTWKWKKARAAFLADHPYCAACRGRGHLVFATVVDHVIPHRGDRAAFWNTANWQALCVACHNAKSARGQ